LSPKLFLLSLGGPNCCHPFDITPQCTDSDVQISLPTLLTLFHTLSLFYEGGGGCANLYMPCICRACHGLAPIMPSFGPVPAARSDGLQAQRPFNKPSRIYRRLCISNQSIQNQRCIYSQPPCSPSATATPS